MPPSGAFSPAQGWRCARHDRVLLQTPRGLEVGSILGPATLRQARLLGAHVRGELIRTLGPDDEPIVEQMAAIAQNVLATSECLRNEFGIALSILDAEAFFDLRHALVAHPSSEP